MPQFKSGRFELKDVHNRSFVIAISVSQPKNGERSSIISAP